tara:strand:+ start:232 stop:1029 length:798 start_codon:yes stop_codon:yes gene_type:complete
MKYISLLVTCLFVISCGNAKEASAMTKQGPLTGTYIITTVGETALNSTDFLITFAIEKNMVSGYSGCNNFSGSYEYKGAALNFGPLASTRKMCRPETNKIEQSILKALNKTIRFTDENSIITLYNNEGKTLMTLEKPKPSVTKIAKEQKDYNATYTAISRGYYVMISYENNSISFQKDRNSKPQVLSLSETQIASLNAKIDTLELDRLENLEAPSKAHQYDGAAIAGLKIIQNGTNYQTPSFDAGNPPKVIEALVSELIMLTEKQ